MEHFSVIQSIIRAGLSGDSGAFDKQVVRLRTRLEKAGATKEAATIERLLKAATETKDIKPSRVEVSRAHISGEVLTPDTNPPIDRETGASLCQVHFPTGERNMPVYEGRVFETVAGLLEEWSSADALRNVGVEPTRSLLIFGPPGSGKTLTATYIADRWAHIVFLGHNGTKYRQSLRFCKPLLVRVAARRVRRLGQSTR